MHLDIILSLRADVNMIPSRPPAFVRDENINQNDSDSESDYRLEIADCGAPRSEMEDDR